MRREARVRQQALVESKQSVNRYRVAGADLTDRAVHGVDVAEDLGGGAPIDLERIALVDRSR